MEGMKIVWMKLHWKAQGKVMRLRGPDLHDVGTQTDKFLEEAITRCKQLDN